LIALLQRVSRASVEVGGERVGAIERGLLVFLAVEEGDGETQMSRLADRVARYRCFPDESGARPMDRSLLDLGLGALVVSQFTLCASTRKGLRPGFDKAAEPGLASQLYEAFAAELSRLGVVRVETGIFAAHMEVSLVNDGPVTLWLEQP
jgi:D-aminoacyl-tRNA deacylase